MSESLIIGSTGLIGRTLSEYYRKKNIYVNETSRKPGIGTHFFDLRDSAVSSLPISEVVYLCAASCNINDCENNPVATAEINITRTLEIIDHVIEQGAFVVYLSSSAVFSGKEEYYKPDCILNPVNEYGRQKAVVETVIQEKYAGSVAVVRLSKVLGENDSRFVSWLRALNNQQCISPFYDLLIAPIPVEYVAACLYKIGTQQSPGIYHLCADRELSYAEGIGLLADKYAMDKALIKGISMYDTAVNTSLMQRHVTLWVEDTISKFGFARSTCESAILSIDYNLS